ncbi:MAG TPA: ATP-binding protein [Woeseiaceae bacterium]|nr:ATP-binding protein [Woeseiaceae bacterium]
MDKATKLELHRETRSARSAERTEPERRTVDDWMSEELKHSLIQRIARLEAALALTAGTVHDVNNVLTVLAGNLFLLTESVRDQPELFEQARRARNAAERGSTLLRELLTFNRDTEDGARAISPAEHVRSLEPLLARAIGSDNELEIAIDRKTGSVDGSAAQFESVLINLAINARDALKPHGKVRIAVADTAVDDRRAAELHLAPGSYVRIEVADNGCGIPERHLVHVTEPLFSTKPAEQGSGLGLSMVKRFAEQSNGALTIESWEGRGTRVRIWLPRSERLAETTANMTLPLSTLPSGDEVLVLVSRDPDVRASMQQILETLGYTVLAADTYEKAEDLLGRAPALLIGERSAEGSQVEQRWLASLRETNPCLRHVALLQAGADPARAAPDADGHLFRPVNVLMLAQSVRNVLET